MMSGRANVSAKSASQTPGAAGSDKKHQPRIDKSPETLADYVFIDLILRKDIRIPGYAYVSDYLVESASGF
jgi:hypothetical protein